MAKVLVTGAAGFIGAEVAAQAVQAGHSVVAIDNFSPYYDPRLKRHRADQLRGSLKFLELSVEDRAQIFKLFADHKFEVVYHLAARPGVGPSVADPHAYVATNLTGTTNILEAMTNASVPKLVFASTSSVYAGEPLPFTEGAAVNCPISPYAASKKAAEQMAYTYHYHFGLSCSVVRYFTVYGPAGRPDMSVFRFVRWIDQGQKLKLMGDGQQRRDFTYVQDIARGTLLSARCPGFEIINLGGGREPVTMLDVIGQIEAGLNKKAVIEHLPAVKADMRDTRAEISKAKQLLDWSPRVTLTEGLTQTIEWYKKNRDFVLELDL